jgi:hypothetical protein
MGNTDQGFDSIMHGKFRFGNWKLKNVFRQKRGIKNVKKTSLLLCMTVLISAVAISAEKPFGVEEFKSVKELADSISSYFPKVQGEVKEVRGDVLTVALGKKDGLKTGVILDLWRAGKEILHPTTGAVLGRAEEELGHAEVVEVGETSSVIRVLKKLKDPEPGDTARISPKKIRLALLPLRAGRPDIIQDLAVRLNETGRFSVLENEKVTQFLKDRKQRDSSVIKEMGHTFELDVIATVEIYPSEGGKLLVTTGMFYADDARPITINTIMAMLDLKTKKEPLAEVKPFFAPDSEDTFFFAEGKGFMADAKVTAGLPFKARLFAVGDLEGNGIIHYVFSDGSKIHIFRQEQAGWREEWAEVGSIARGEMFHINIDVADINGNGNQEIFVTAMQNEKVVSYVMEFRGGSCRRIAAMPGFLRVVKYPGKGDVLIGQSYDPTLFYLGKPRQYTWSDGKYVAEYEFPLPKGVDLYGFVIANMGEDHPFLVALNDRYELVVYSNNNAIWKSVEKYLTPTLTVVKPMGGIDAAFKKDAAERVAETGGPAIYLSEQKATFKIRGRVLALDVNGDGKEVIIMPKNSAIPYLDYIGINYLSGYKDSEFVGLSWTGTRLEQQFSIKKVPGVVMDARLLRQQDAATKLVVLERIPGWWIRKDTIQVTSYSVK